MSLTSNEFVITTPELEMKYDPRGLGYNFFHSMKKHKTKIAQIDVQTGEEQTYDDLFWQCVRTAMHMKNLGITNKDVISMCSYNRLEACVPFIAATFLGAKIATLDPRQSNVDKLIKQIEAKLIFADEAGIRFLKESDVTANIVSFDGSRDYLNFKDFIQEKPREEEFTPYEAKDEKETAVIFFTSGTTGFPKGVCVNHYALLRQGYYFTRVFGGNTDRTLYFSTLYWISAACLLTDLISTGQCKLVCPKFDPHKVWFVIDKYKPTFMFVSTVQAVQMCKAGRPKYIDISSLKKFSFGGSTISSEMYQEIQQMLPNVAISQGYGQTEVSGAIALFDSNIPEDIKQGNEKPLSCGKPIKGFDYKVTDPETEKNLGPYQKGELRVKTKFIFNGYYKTDSSDAFDSEGWLKTGDLVYYDEDYCFYIVDRIKELFKYKDWHIAPSTIEKVLLTHPAVENCVVVGMPHEEDTTHALGVVVLKPTHKDANSEDIVTYVAKRIDEKYHLKAGVKIVKEFPLTPTGKVSRRNIKNLIIDGKL